MDVDTGRHNPDSNPLTSTRMTKVTGKKRKNAVLLGGDEEPSTVKKNKAKQVKSPSKPRQKAAARESSPEPVQVVRGKCFRCREKGIKCNEGKPSCNQCLRGLWTCQYETPGSKKRSKNGCFNCRSRKRKCTEERPSCAHCLKVDDDCMYGEYA